METGLNLLKRPTECWPQKQKAKVSSCIVFRLKEVHSYVIVLNKFVAISDHLQRIGETSPFKINVMDFKCQNNMMIVFAKERQTSDLVCVNKLSLLEGLWNLTGNQICQMDEQV